MCDSDEAAIKGRVGSAVCLFFVVVVLRSIITYIQKNEIQTREFKSGKLNEQKKLTMLEIT